MFAFFLTFNPQQEESELTLGYYDESRFVPDSLHWHDVTHSVFFALELVDVRLGNKSLNLCGPTSTLNKKCTITPDSGTSYMTVPDWAFKQMENSDDKRLQGDFPCSKAELLNEDDFVFVLSNGVEYRIPATHWLNVGEGRC